MFRCTCPPTRPPLVLTSNEEPTLLSYTAWLLGDAKATVDRRLRAGQRAALSPSLGAPPAAILAPTMDLRVTVHEEKGSAARMEMDSREGVEPLRQRARRIRHGSKGEGPWSL